MNIIEAIQHAENGKLITGGFLKRNGHFLKYIKNGVFFQYKLVNGKSEYKYEVRDFTVDYILANDWEILNDSNGQI